MRTALKGTSQDKFVWKVMAVSLLKFIPLQSGASDVSPNHLSLYRTGVNSSYNFWNCRFDDYFPLNSTWINLLKVPAAVESIFSLLLMLWIYYSLLRRWRTLRHRHLSFTIMAGAALHILSMWLFTEYLPRYNIATFVLLIFVGVFWTDEYLSRKGKKSADSIT